MSVFQVINGPDLLPLQSGGYYSVVFSYNLGSPPAPFDGTKREYWAHAEGQKLGFDDEDIDDITEITGIDYASCTDFVDYLLGKNGGPPPFTPDRVSISTASYLDRPDTLGASPSIPGWTTTGHTYVQFVGLHGRTPFQGVMLRRANIALRVAQTYWLTDAPSGYLQAGDDVQFLGEETISPSDPLTPKELITEFPNWLPNPGSAGDLKDYYLWYDEISWLTLSSNNEDWEDQVCT